MDALDIKYNDNYFDVVIDKSTLDSIICSNYGFLHAAIMLKNV